MKAFALISAYFAVVSFSTPTWAANSWQATSASEQTHLIEVFSSEGCSSCPPADEWIASLRGDAGLWKKFVPIEFHVDYWNRLGWTDRFSKGVFTGRQHNYAQAWGSDSVYTPGFVLDGREWRSRVASEYENSGKNVGVLHAEQVRGGVFRVTFKPTENKAGHYIVSGALLGDGLDTDVRAGENSGRKLHHEFVVLDLESKTADDTIHSVEIELRDKGAIAPRSFSAAFWVTQSNSVRPLQAVGGDLKQGS